MLHSAANQAYCIDIAQDTSARRTPVRLFTCHGGENQRWVLAPDADGRTTVAGLAGQCLDVKPHAGGGANARLDPCTGAPNQQFVFDAAGRLHDQTSGKCLTVTKEARGTPILALPCDAGNPGQVWSTLER
jgi:alpha-galactosidase